MPPSGIKVENKGREGFPMGQPVKRKLYEAPKLVRYGDLVEVTTALTGSSQKNDNAHTNLKTA